MNYDKIIEHLVDISKGKCSITEESILKLDNKEEQMIELGLLTLFDEITYNRKCLEQSNLNKDYLLKEVHHRVKNNLQIISSILSIESKYVDDENARKILENCKSRVYTIGEIHQRLYSSDDSGNVELKSFLLGLIDDYKLTSSSRYKKLNFQLDFRAGRTKVPLNKIIPLGLIINELFTNSLKYGNDNEKTIEIHIRVAMIGEKYELIFSDDGRGYIEREKNYKGMGMKLIDNLIGQIEGSIERFTIENSTGTNYRIEFSV